ncbi:MAG: LytTR family DNA-binding domain-containing protein [Hyphomicrobiales bacterium]
MAFAIVVGLFALTGPFGTYEALGFTARLGYWFITQAITWAIALSTIAFCGALMGTLPFRDFRTVLIGAALASMPITVAVEIIGFAVFGRPVTIAGIGWQLLSTVPVALLLGTFTYLVVRPSSGVDKAAPVSAPGGRLVRRLPAGKRGAVLYLSMHDHYVEVVTAKGSELVLMRFGDALDELDGSDGLRIHRSHWVARKAVAGWRRENGRLTLEMSDGAELPVSRSYAKAVRAAGLADDAEAEVT